MVLNTSGDTRTIAFDISNFFLQNRAYYWSSTTGHTTSLFPIELFLSSRRLLVVWNTSGPLILECDKILSWSISLFYFNCLLDDVADSSCDKPSDLSQQAELQLYLKIKTDGKHIYFSSATFVFWYIKIYYLMLFVQAQTSKAVIQN